MVKIGPGDSPDSLLYARLYWRGGGGHAPVVAGEGAIGRQRWRPTTAKALSISPPASAAGTGSPLTFNVDIKEPLPPPFGRSCHSGRMGGAEEWEAGRSGTQEGARATVERVVGGGQKPTTVKYTEKQGQHSHRNGDKGGQRLRLRLTLRDDNGGTDAGSRRQQQCLTRVSDAGLLRIDGSIEIIISRIKTRREGKLAHLM